MSDMNINEVEEELDCPHCGETSYVSQIDGICPSCDRVFIPTPFDGNVELGDYGVDKDQSEPMDIDVVREISI